MSERKDTIISSKNPGLWARARGEWSSLWSGGGGNAWESALCGMTHDSRRVRQRSFKLAKRLHAANISAKDASKHAFFQLLDYLVAYDRPTQRQIEEAEEEKARGLRLVSQMYDTFEMALQCGMDPNRQYGNNYNDCGLHRAAAAGSCDTIKLLVKYKADLGCRDGNGFTPLACALNGWGERKGSTERRTQAARMLIEAGAPLDKGRQRTHYPDNDGGPHSTTGVLEDSPLDAAEDMPELLIELIELGAPLSWEINARYIEGSQLIPGDETRNSSQHIFFSFNSSVWNWKEKKTLRKFLRELGKKSGPLKNLISTRGMTTAMEMICQPHTLGIDRYADFNPSQALKNIDEMIKADVIALEDKGTGGSNIWHALFTHLNEKTKDLTLLLMENYPHLTGLMDEPNKAGVRPVDILRYYRNGNSSGEIKTNNGPVKAVQVHYGESWHNTLDTLISVVSQKTLADISRRVRRTMPAQDLDQSMRVTPKM